MAMESHGKSLEVSLGKTWTNCGCKNSPPKGWLKPYIYINNGLNLLLTGAAFLPSAMFDDTSALRQTAQGSKGASTNGLLEAHDPTNQHMRWMTQVCAPLNGYDMN